MRLLPSEAFFLGSNCMQSAPNLLVCLWVLPYGGSASAEASHNEQVMPPHAPTLTASPPRFWPVLMLHSDTPPTYVWGGWQVRESWAHFTSGQPDLPPSACNVCMLPADRWAGILAGADQVHGPSG